MGKQSKQERARRYADGAKEAVRLAAIQEVLAARKVGELTQQILDNLAELDKMNVTLGNLGTRIKDLGVETAGKMKVLGEFQNSVATISTDINAIRMTVEMTAEKLGMDLSKVEIPEDAVMETENLSRAEREARELAVEAVSETKPELPLIGPEAEVERKMKISTAEFLEKEG